MVYRRAKAVVFSHLTCSYTNDQPRSDWRHPTRHIRRRSWHQCTTHRLHSYGTETLKSPGRGHALLWEKLPPCQSIQDTGVRFPPPMSPQPWNWKSTAGELIWEHTIEHCETPVWESLPGRHSRPHTLIQDPHWEDKEQFVHETKFLTSLLDPVGQLDQTLLCQQPWPYATLVLNIQALK